MAGVVEGPHVHFKHFQTQPYAVAAPPPTKKKNWKKFTIFTGQYGWLSFSARFSGHFAVSFKGTRLPDHLKGPHAVLKCSKSMTLWEQQMPFPVIVPELVPAPMFHPEPWGAEGKRKQ